MTNINAFYGHTQLFSETILVTISYIKLAVLIKNIFLTYYLIVLQETTCFTNQVLCVQKLFGCKQLFLFSLYSIDKA